MSIVNVDLAAVGDTRISSAVAIHSLAYLARHADEHGNIGANDEGLPAGDPRVVAAARGYGKSSVSKAMGDLEKLGYLSWHRATGYEHKRSITGRVRILTPSQS